MNKRQKYMKDSSLDKSLIWRNISFFQNLAYSDLKFYHFFHRFCNLNTLKFKNIGFHAATFQSFFYKQLTLHRINYGREGDKHKFETHTLKTQLYFKSRMMRLFSYHSY